MWHRNVVLVSGLLVSLAGCSVVDGIRTDHRMNHYAKKAWDRHESCFEGSPNEDDVEDGFREGYLQYVYHGCAQGPNRLPSRFNRPSYQTCFGKAGIQAYHEGFRLGVAEARNDCSTGGRGGRTGCRSGRGGFGAPAGAGCGPGGCHHGGGCATCEAPMIPSHGAPVYAPDGAWHESPVLEGVPLLEGAPLPAFPMPSGDAKPDAALPPPPEPSESLPKAPADGSTPPAAPTTSYFPGGAPFAAPTATPYPMTAPSTAPTLGMPSSFGPNVIGPNAVLPMDEEEVGAVLPTLQAPSDPLVAEPQPPAASRAPALSVQSPTPPVERQPAVSSEAVSGPPGRPAPPEGWRPYRRPLNDEVAPLPEAGRETPRR